MGTKVINWFCQQCIYRRILDYRTKYNHKSISKLVHGWGVVCAGDHSCTLSSSTCWMWQPSCPWSPFSFLKALQPPKLKLYSWNDLECLDDRQNNLKLYKLCLSNIYFTGLICWISIPKSVILRGCGSFWRSTYLGGPCKYSFLGWRES